MTLTRALPVLLALALPSHAQELPRIGVAAPSSGPNAVLGRQVTEGTEAAMRGRATTVEADTQCTAEGGRAAAERFAAEKVSVVVGFICTESLETALPILRAAGIAAIDIGVRADRFTAQRRRTGDLIWRLAPRSDAEATALAAFVLARWRDGPFGILDDGSIYGRGLADAVRSKIEAAELRPAVIDTFRPAEEKQFGIARRLLRSGVTRFVVAGERTDAAIIARDAAASGVNLEMLGGESFLDEPSETAQLPVGTHAVAPQTRFPSIAGPGRADATERQGYFGPAFVAATIAQVTVAEADASKRPLSVILDEHPFSTPLGDVRFDEHGDSNLDLFRTFRFDGQDFGEEEPNG